VKPTDEFGPFAVGGGLHIVGGTATVIRSIISGSRVSVTAPSADVVVGIAEGIDDDSTLTLDRRTVANNDTNLSVRLRRRRPRSSRARWMSTALRPRRSTSGRSSTRRGRVDGSR
jgi:hypothetical protein